MRAFQPRAIAVIGAGLAGAACAQALSQAGHRVQVFDKSRGPGGRLATRRAEWLDAQGHAHTTRLDHGAVGIQPRTAPFRAFTEAALQAGWLAEWLPVVAPVPGHAAAASNPANAPWLVPTPDSPSLCRRLLDGIGAFWSCPVDGLARDGRGWHLSVAGAHLDGGFDAVVLAIPPTQAAPLLRAHRADWAERAGAVAMQPGWTLMGVADAPTPVPVGEPLWSMMQPASGPLACVQRSDDRPGREAVAGQAHWVAHARSDWSAQHLEHAADWVQAQLETALSDCVGAPVRWQHRVVHRWRYALPPAQLAAESSTAWWDGAQQLGVCGDFLGGRDVDGVEGAWLSAQALVTHLQDDTHV